MSSIFCPSLSQITFQYCTPEIPPLDHDAAEFMTPLSNCFLKDSPCDTFDDFALDQVDSIVHEPINDHRTRRYKNEFKENIISMFKIENDLQLIAEDDLEHSQCLSCAECLSNQNLPAYSPVLPFKAHSTDTTATLLKPSIQKDCEQQKQSTIDFSTTQFQQNIQRFNGDPKGQIVRLIRQIQQNPTDEHNKKMLIKKQLQKYLVEHEYYCYEEAWEELTMSLPQTISTLLKGLEETFSKRIGPLSFELRRTKLLKYLEKKKKRIWKKKVSYNCRKKVADGRLRIKGKFVTREQACVQLGVQSLAEYTSTQIKQMLEHKMQEHEGQC